jgi:hypothetical protein
MNGVAMKYIESVTDFFKSPSWMMNLLLAGVCTLIPIIGPMVILGWLITGFWGRPINDFASFPPFDFANFGKYLERGIWPFLVAFIAGVVIVPLLWIAMLPAVLLGGLTSNNHGTAGGCFAGLVVCVMVVLFTIVIIVLKFLLVPLVIRATLTQDFAKAFDFGFAKQFLALTWKEIILGSLFAAVASIVLICVGAVVFCIGMYFASVVIYFCWVHLYSQIYTLYLSRGGEPVPVSPKLVAAP